MPEEEQKQQEVHGNEELTWIARLINHLLTPGSSLTLLTWVVFNCIMGALFLVWLSFAVVFPHNVHVWVFGFLGLGLAGSTNWLLRIIFREHLDFSSQQQAQSLEDKKKD